MLKKITFIIIYLTLFAPLQTFSIDFDVSIIPEDPSILLLFSGKKELAETIVSRISDSDEGGAILNVLNYRDENSMSIGYINLRSWDHDEVELSEEIRQNSILFIPIVLNQADILSVLEEEFEVKIEDDTIPIYSLNEEVYCTFTHASNGDYILLSMEQLEIEDYQNSKKIDQSPSKDATKITTFIEQNSNHIFSMYLGPDVIESFEDIIDEFEVESVDTNSQNQSNENKIDDEDELEFDPTQEFGYRYNIFTDIDYVELSIPQLEIPINADIKVHLSDDDVLARILELSRTKGTDYLATNQNIYFEINLNSKFLLQFFKLTDFFEDVDISEEKLDKIQKSFSGNVVVAAYQREGIVRPSIYSRFPYFIIVLGVEDSVEISKQISSLLEYEVIRVGGSLVQKFETENNRIQEIFLFLNEEDLIIANNQDLVTDYIENWNNWEDVFTDEILVPENADPILLFQLESSQLINELVYKYFDDFWVQFDFLEIELFFIENSEMIEFKLRIR